MTRHKHASAGTTSITAHRLFPATVGLWFAALFGLGSLAVRASVLEDAVLAIGLDHVIPAAAPPLGVTARILLALAMAGLGGAIGALLAVRLFRPRAGEDRPTVKVRARDAHPDAPARRPLSISEDCGEEIVERPPRAERIGGRRRSLTVEESAPSEFLDYAPLPGGPLLHGHIDADEEEEELAEADKPLELTDVDSDESVSAAEAAPLRPRLFDAVALEADEGEPEPEPETSDQPEPVMRDTIDPIGEPVAEADLDGLSTLKLTERLAIAMQRRRDHEAALAAEAQAQAEAVAKARAEALAEAQAQALAQAEAAARALAESQAAAQPEVLASAAAPSAPEPILTEAMPPAVLPAALRPLSFDDEADEEDGMFAGLVPPRHFQINGVTAAFDVPEGLEDGASAEPAPLAEARAQAEPLDKIDEEALEDGYSSLLGLSRRPAIELQSIRVPDPEPVGDTVEPVVIFPGHGARPAPAPGAAAAIPAEPPHAGGLRRFDAPGSVPPPRSAPAASAINNDPEETARALRSALATLQRMSGAA